jgi:prolipoprotein diacylglyceryltransferase
LRKLTTDQISNGNRLSIILGAIVGAFVGSRLIGFLENPMITFNTQNMILLLNTKSIMGGLFGGLIGVESSKIIIKEKHSSGDLFTFPIIVGIIIGRIGCFLSGIKEFTYGNETSLITGIDLGDGLSRHPTSLYEIIFLILLFIFLKKITLYTNKESGLLFKIFMISYFGFRFMIEFLKPNIFYVLGLSSIQLLCMTCWIYYTPTLKKIMKNAY